ncbi:uncharacterized protein [Littorina saxatilis]|uniref:Sushi domain-containing protein n=1 Tax=Littorina saxatilis TaxID=31220 RepID=A0AAN9C463_9CAEN
MEGFPPYLSKLVLQFCMSYVMTVVAENPSSYANVTERIDVIGSFSLQNEEQCRRLCWYQDSCTSYSFCSPCDRRDDNCVLHSSHVEGGTNTHAAHQDYTEKPATGLNPGHGCSGRPCGQKEFCVPGLGGRHQCVPRPAMCPIPPVPARRVVYSDMEQDERNTLVCEEHFVVSPRNASMGVQCQVNSRWTSPRGECLQAEFFNTSSPFTGLIPWNLTVGWGLCFKATYQGILYLNLLIAADDPENIVFHLAMNVGTTGVRWDKLSAATGWSSGIGGYKLSSLPVNLNEPFALSFTLNDINLHITLIGYERKDYSIPTGWRKDNDYVNLTGVRYLMTSRQAEVSYVNLLSGDDCAL